MFNFLEETTMFRSFGQVLSKRMQKVPHFTKKHEQSSIRPKCKTTTFRRLGQLLSKNLQKVAHFAKRHEKSPIWPKLATFSSKGRSLRVGVNVSAKSVRKCLISQKSRKNRRFGQNVQVFRANRHVSACSSSFTKKF